MLVLGMLHIERCCEPVILSGYSSCDCSQLQSMTICREVFDLRVQDYYVDSCLYSGKAFLERDLIMRNSSSESISIESR